MRLHHVNVPAREDAEYYKHIVNRPTLRLRKKLGWCGACCVVALLHIDLLRPKQSMARPPLAWISPIFFGSRARSVASTTDVATTRSVRNIQFVTRTDPHIERNAATLLASAAVALSSRRSFTVESPKRQARAPPTTAPFAFESGRCCVDFSAAPFHFLDRHLAHLSSTAAHRQTSWEYLFLLMHLRSKERDPTTRNTRRRWQSAHFCCAAACSFLSKNTTQVLSPIEGAHKMKTPPHRSRSNLCRSTRTSLQTSSLLEFSCCQWRHQSRNIFPLPAAQACALQPHSSSQDDP